MTHWGDTYMPSPHGKRLSFVDRRDGKPIRPMAVYAADGRKLKAQQIKAKPGPAFISDGQASPMISPLVRHGDE